MHKRLVAVAVVAACLPSAVPAAPAATTPREVRAALDYFCKPFASGQVAGVRAGAVAAGWTEYGLAQFYRDGAWGRVNVTFRPGNNCSVTVPVGGAKGREMAILDVVGAWGRTNGFAAGQARATKPLPLYDTVSETWARDGKVLRAYAYVNRRKDDMLIPAVEIVVR